MPKVMAKGSAAIMSVRNEAQSSPICIHSSRAGAGGATRSSHHNDSPHPVTAPPRKAAVNAVAEVDPFHTSTA